MIKPVVSAKACFIQYLNSKIPEKNTFMRYPMINKYAAWNPYSFFQSLWAQSALTIISWVSLAPYHSTAWGSMALSFGHLDPSACAPNIASANQVNSHTGWTCKREQSSKLPVDRVEMVTYSWEVTNVRRMAFCYLLLNVRNIENFVLLIWRSRTIINAWRQPLRT